MFIDPLGSEMAKAVRDSIRTNTRIVSEFPRPMSDEAVPFAIVTPDGEWHEKGRMGWFACVSDKRDDWKDQARAVIDRYREGQFVAVGVDCHI